MRNAFPPGYYACVDRLNRVIRDVTRERGAPPRFALPPREIAFVADLGEMGARLVRNDVAREIIRRVTEAARGANRPTVAMLAAVLREEWIERVSLADILVTADGNRRAQS